MSRTQFVITLTVVAIAGLAGGLLSEHLPGSAAFAQGDAPAVIEAREFRVVDADGTTRAMLGMTEEGPRLRLCDAAGERRLGAGVMADGVCGLSIYGPEGKPRLALTLLPDGLAQFEVAGVEDDPGAVALVVQPDGSRAVAIAERSGTRAAAQLSVTADGVRTLKLQHPSEAVSCGLQLVPQENLAQVILGRGHESIQHACIVARPQASSVHVGHHDAGASAMLAVAEFGPRLDLDDEDGHPRITAGYWDPGVYGMALLDGAGTPRLQVTEGSENAYGIAINRPDGSPLMVVPFEPEIPWEHR